MPECTVCEKDKPYASSQDICSDCLRWITKNDKQNLTVDAVMAFIKTCCGSDSYAPGEILDSGDIEEAITHKTLDETASDIARRLYVEYARESAGLAWDDVFERLIVEANACKHEAEKNDV